MSRYFVQALFTGLSAGMLWLQWLERHDGWMLSLAIWLSASFAYEVWSGIDSAREARARARRMGSVSP